MAAAPAEQGRCAEGVAAHAGGPGEARGGVLRGCHGAVKALRAFAGMMSWPRPLSERQVGAVTSRGGAGGPPSGASVRRRARCWGARNGGRRGASGREMAAGTSPRSPLSAVGSPPPSPPRRVSEVQLLIFLEGSLLFFSLSSLFAPVLFRMEGGTGLSCSKWKPGIPVVQE